MQGWKLPLAVCGLLLATAPLAEVRAAPSAEELRTWLGELNDDRYEVRERAEARLIKAGPAAIEVLVTGLSSDQAEVAWRSGAALERIGLEADEQTIDKIVAQLDAASQKTQREGLKRLASELHARQKLFRRKGAIAQIRKNGGRLGGPWMEFAAGDMGAAPPLVVALAEAGAEPAAEPAEDKDAVDEALKETMEDPLKRAPAEVLDALEGFGEALFKALEPDKKEEPAPEAIADDPPDVVALPAPVAVDEMVLLGFAGGMADIAGDRVAAGGLTQITLDANWRGGDAGLAGLEHITELAQIDLAQTRLTDKSLAHLEKVANLRQLNLYKPGFSRDGLFKFHRQRPEVVVYARGDAMMGVHGDLNSSPLVLTLIQEGSGALEAGLLAGDVIHQIDGLEIRDFSDLTIFIASKASGDTISVQYERDGKKRTADVTLEPRVD